jgi:uncharacterized membrane-anchored protein
MRKLAVWLVGMSILVAVNFAIWQKEQLLTHGKTVILALAPVDPRSLMQGDYMRLRFQAEQDMQRYLPYKKDSSVADGYVIVSLNDQHIGEVQGVVSELPATLAVNQWPLRYRIRAGELRFATNAFFFQEGHADDYAQARYGEFKVNNDGEMLLANLRGQHLEVLGFQAVIK